MGNKQTKPSSTAPVAKTEDESSSEEEENAPKMPVDEESQMFIDLIIVQEFPHGSTSSRKLTVDPLIKVSKFKKDLSHLVNIPPENIQIYRYQNPQTQMPNNSTLQDLMVPNDKQLLIRDSRCTYQNPINPH